jgi:hypothetical protein
LVTLKSTLDVLAIILSKFINSKSDDIRKLTEEMKKNKDLGGLRAKLKVLFGESKNEHLVNEFINQKGAKSKRNYAVHHGSLSTGTINLQFSASAPTIGVIKSKAMPVGDSLGVMHSEQDLDHYCTERFYATCDLVIDALKLVFDEELPRGKKMSVYEAKRS